MNNSNYKNRVKRAIFLIATYFTVIFTVKANTDNKNESYPYNDTSIEIVSPYATYSNGNIYIANSDVIKQIIVDSSDVYIIDNRFSTNPNICICNSYKINNKNDIDEILDILLKYEEEYPSQWNRDFITMRREWIMHNLCYYFEVEKYRTAEVDLNNDDEEMYLTLKK
jgi:hypothetical protein